MTLLDRLSRIIVLSNKNKPEESNNLVNQVKFGIGPSIRVQLIPGVHEKLAGMEQ